MVYYWESWNLDGHLDVYATTCCGAENLIRFTHLKMRTIKI